MLVRNVHDGYLKVIVGREPAGPRGELLWHLSISHGRGSAARPLSSADGKAIPGRIPTWEEIHDARYEFCPDEVHMAMILPPKAEYVNVHPTTMHLHELMGSESPAIKSSLPKNEG